MDLRTVSFDHDRTVAVRHYPRAQAAVAGPNPACARAGEQVARDGGNAVDVAIAAVVTALVTEPGIASLGGGAFLTVAAPGRRAVTVDGSVSMPGKGLPASAFGRGLRTVSMSYGGGTTLEAGRGSVATPGTLAALELAHRRYGRLPWAALWEPAAEVARAGFPMGRAAANYLGHARGPVFGADDAALAVLTAPGGRALAEGDVLRMPELADFLDLVARDGAAALHQGELAKRLVADMTEHGGLLTEADLREYRAVERPALTVRAGRWEWATNPPPSVGGSVLAAMLVLFDDLLAARPTEELGLPLEALVAVQEAVLTYRVRELDVAPDDRARVAAAAALVDAVAGRGRAWLPTSPSTVHVSAVDGDGGACSVTASSGYGAGVSAPGTGLWLNNCLGERELNRRGVHALAPGERLVSNMSPTIGRHDDGSVLAIGSPGADRIASAVAQVLLGLISGDSLAAAISRPRVHVTVGDDGRALRVEHEADVRPPLVVSDAQIADLPWREHPPQAMFFGGVAVAARTADGTLEAAADPRREGAVAVVD